MSTPRVLSPRVVCTPRKFDIELKPEPHTQEKTITTAIVWQMVSKALGPPEKLYLPYMYCLHEGNFYIDRRQLANEKTGFTSFPTRERKIAFQKAAYSGVSRVRKGDINLCWVQQSALKVLSPLDLAQTDAPGKLHAAARHHVGSAPDFMVNNAGALFGHETRLEWTDEGLDQRGASKGLSGPWGVPGPRVAARFSCPSFTCVWCASASLRWQVFVIGLSPVSPPTCLFAFLKKANVRRAPRRSNADTSTSCRKSVPGFTRPN